MHVFLGRIAEQAGVSCEWERLRAIRSPTRRGVGPADHRPDGTTGADLVREFKRWCAQGGPKARPIDGVLYIDDADCRCCPELDATGMNGRDGCTENLRQQLEESVATNIGADGPPVYVLLASPHIEAWLIADWDASFRKSPGHAKKQVQIRRNLKQLVGKALLTEPEAAGCPRRGDACTWRLSDRLNTAVAEEGLRYNKRIDGADMLSRVDPGRVARVCTKVFAPAHLRFVNFLRAPDAPQQHRDTAPVSAAPPPSSLLP